jgi:5'-nucleotidase
MQKNLILLSVALLALVSCSQLKSTDESHIYIISTNDMHANIEAMPRLATLVKEFEAKGEVVLVDSGDRVTGNAYVDDDAQPGIPMVELMNAVGYDVVTLGNHEFDKGREALYAMVDAAEFEWVCSNIVDNVGEGFKPYVTMDIEDVDITFVGVVATDFNGRPMGGDASFVGFSFTDDVATSFEVCQDVAEESDFVVLLSHMGYDMDSRFADMTPACDWVAGGHSHDITNAPVNGVHISQNRKDIRYVTVADITVKDGDIVAVEYEQIESVNYAEDEDVRAMVEEIKSRDLGLNAVVAHANAHATRTGIANFTCDALKNYTYAEGFVPEVVFYHYGGVRLSEIKEGDVKRVDILNNDPFISTIYIGEMSVKEMSDFIHTKYNNGTEEKPDKESHYVYFCSNVPYEIVLGATPENRPDAVNVRFDLEPRKYRVAMCNYIAENYLDKEVLARCLKESDVTVREAMLQEMCSYGEAGFTPDNNSYQVEVKE